MDGELFGHRAGVAALAGDGHLGRTGVGVVRIGDIIVLAAGQRGAAVLDRDGGLLRLAVVGVGGLFQIDCAGGDDFFGWVGRVSRVGGTSGVVVDGGVFERIIALSNRNIRPLNFIATVVNIA